MPRLARASDRLGPTPLRNWTGLSRLAEVVKIWYLLRRHVLQMLHLRERTPHRQNGEPFPSGNQPALPAQPPARQDPGGRRHAVARVRLHHLPQVRTRPQSLTGYSSELAAPSGSGKTIETK